MRQRYGKVSGMSYTGADIGKPMSARQKKNYDGGGYAFEPNAWTQFKKWLILGSDSPTYYATPQKLTVDNAKYALACLRKDPIRYIDTVAEVASKGLAPRRHTTLFAFALVFTHGSNAAKSYAREKLMSIVYTGDDIANFASMIVGEKDSGVRVDYMRGWGRSVRNTVAAWYNGLSIEKLVYQLIKYRTRHGFSQGNLIKLSHPKPDTNARSAVYRWAVHGDVPEMNLQDESLEQLFAYEAAKTTVDSDGNPIMEQKKKLINLIRLYGLPWEAVPNQWLNDPDVLKALFYNMPGQATLRQIPRLSNAGLLEDYEVKEELIRRFGSHEYIRQQRLHPLKILQAHRIYSRGGGVRSSWKTVPWVVDMLDGAFYLSFDNVEPTNKNVMINVDCSGSMLGNDDGGGWSIWPDCSGLTGVSPMYAAAAMATIRMRTEPFFMLVGFSNGIQEIPIRSDSTLNEVYNAMKRVNAMATNIAAGMEYATKKGLPVDLFEIYTDNQGNRGMHPSAAIDQYRNNTGRDARVGFVAMVSYPHSVADPNKPYMMDFIGFDPTTPQMITRWASGELDVS